LPRTSSLSGSTLALDFRFDDIQRGRGNLQPIEVSGGLLQRGWLGSEGGDVLEHLGDDEVDDGVQENVTISSV
jgi:hypothetical protein